MSFSFLNPWALVLLVSLPLAALLVLRSRSGLDTARRWTSLSLRLVILLLLVLSLAEVRLLRTADKLTVIFCLDVSKSVPRGLRGPSLDYVREQAKKKQQDDQVALIVFGREAMMETPPRQTFELTDLTSDVSGGFRDYTDISSALRLALAAFPADTQKRIVLLSDGNENKGSAADEIDSVYGSGASIDVVAQKFEAGAEVFVEEINLPSEVQKNESFEVKLVIHSLTDTKARVRLLRNGQPIPGADEMVNLHEGKNPYVATLKVPEEDFYGIEAVVEPVEDVITENNRAFGYTAVRGEPRILYVEGGTEPDAAEYLGRALLELFPDKDREKALAENLTIVGPDQIPLGLMQLQKYDTVIFSNVAASAMTPDQMKSIQAAIRDFGMGFVMIGGENSFGAGGYIDTPIAESLPVELDIPQQKVMPSGALVIVMHTCEIPDGNRWSKEMSVAALRALSAQDWFGVLDYEMTGDVWAVPLRKVGNKQAAEKAILDMSPSDMPSFDTILQKAYVGLINTKAALKHIVVFSDGDPSMPPQSFLNKMAKEKITISTVSLWPHGATASQPLKDLAKAGGGRYWEPQDASKLPQLIVKEAAIVRKALISEQRFVPQAVLNSELIKGIHGASIPALNGYVITFRKDRAETPLVHIGEDRQPDPILAHWVYGLGKSVAFTSDAKNRWAKEWVNWDNYVKFWTQTVRWTMRARSRSNYKVSANVAGGKGHVVLDALDEGGKYVNFLGLKGAAVSPKMEELPLAFQQTAPGRYEADFDANEVGAYMVNVGYQGKDGETGFSTTGVAVSYSPEYKDVKTNVGLLERLARETKGKAIEDPAKENVFRHDLPKTQSPQDLWQRLLWLAICLFWLDVAVRRVVVTRKEIRGAWEKIAERIIPGYHAKPTKTEPVLQVLLARKASIQKQREERKVFQASAAQDAPAVQIPGQPLAPKQPPAPAAGQAPAAQPQEDLYTARLLRAKKRVQDDLGGKK